MATKTKSKQKTYGKIGNKVRRTPPKDGKAFTKGKYTIKTPGKQSQKLPASDSALASKAMKKLLRDKSSAKSTKERVLASVRRLNPNVNHDSKAKQYTVDESRIFLKNYTATGGL